MRGILCPECGKNKFYLMDFRFFVAVDCKYCGYRLRELDISFFSEFPRTEPLEDWRQVSSGNSASIIRPPVILHITMRNRGFEWVAESENLEGFITYDTTREMTEARARRELEPWLGDHVTLEFQ